MMDYLEGCQNQTNVFTNFTGQEYGIIEGWVYVDKGTARVSLGQNGEIVLLFNSTQAYCYNNTELYNLTSSDFTDEWHHYKVEFECGSGNHYGLDQYEYKIYLDNSSYGVFEMNGTPSTLNELKFSTWTTNDTIFYADAIGFSWDGNYVIGANYEDTNITSWNSYFTTKLNGSLPELMNLHSDVLRLIPWLANYKNSQQGNKPQGFSEWMKQKLEEFRDFVVSMFAWLAAALEDLKEMLEEVLNEILMNLFEWLLYLLWLIIRAALLVLFYIFHAIIYGLYALTLIGIWIFISAISATMGFSSSFDTDYIKLVKNNEDMIIGYTQEVEYLKLFEIFIPIALFYFESEDLKFIFQCNFLDFKITSLIIPENLLYEILSEDSPSSSNGLKTSAESENDGILYFGSGCWLMGGWLGVISFAMGGAPDNYKPIVWFGTFITIIAIIVFVLFSLPETKEAYVGLGFGLIFSGFAAIISAVASEYFSKGGNIKLSGTTTKLIDPEKTLFYLSLIDIVFSNADIFITILGAIFQEVKEISSNIGYVGIVFFVGLFSLILGSLSLAFTTEGRGKNGEKNLKIGRYIALTSGVLCVVIGTLLLVYAATLE